MSASPFPEVALSELASIKYGYTESASSQPIGPKFLRITDIQDGSVDWESVPYCAIDVADAKKHQLEDGDIVFARTGATTGKSFLIKEPPNAVPASYLIRLRLTGKKLLPEFLSLFFQTEAYWHSIEKGSSGSAQGGFNASKLGQLKVPVPPLEEQKRIVAVLGQAFTALDRARAFAEANLSDAEEVFPSILRATFSNTSERWLSQLPPEKPETGLVGRSSGRSKIATQTGGRSATTRPIQGDYGLCVLKPEVAARKGWAWTPLTALARLESGHTPSRKRSEYWGGEIGWIGIKDARDHHGGVVYETREQTNPLGIEKSSARVLPAGTVCLSRTASVGYVVIMGRDMATSQDFVNWICRAALSPNFLKYLLLAQGEEIRRFASGSVHQTIYFPEVKGFYICHPTREVQDEICTSLDRACAEAKKLTAFYQEKVKDIADLRQSLLQRAFAGELT
ncbi:hypothetical protein NSE01_36330 [Novosphingobium sediminis]|uniref:Type I restriction modification DNA specificity domain-containing protein n=1 Tax=Novosphingobium sediminis TaxID=707214 RepID=A0A512AQ21_9SPHN|nr:restriction endonuclease subunit S [Novosphingobium sediminis]GEO01801.1 hypothetical protein NSE01_36330 [Novosphingobium sediminis]